MNHRLVLLHKDERATLSSLVWKQFAYMRLLTPRQRGGVRLCDDMGLFFKFVTRALRAPEHVKTLTDIHALREQLLFFGIAPDAVLAGEFVDLVNEYTRRCNVPHATLLMIEDACGERFRRDDVLYLFTLYHSDLVRDVIVASVLPLSEEHVDVRNHDAMRAILYKAPELDTPRDARLRACLDQLRKKGR